MESNLENSNVSMNHRKDFDSDSRRNNGRFRGEKRAHRDDSQCSSSSRSSRSSCGTIHILLRKHLYSTKLNLTSKFFTRTVFFFQTKEFLFQHYILTKFSSGSLKYLVHKEEDKCSKNSLKC